MAINSGPSADPRFTQALQDYQKRRAQMESNQSRARSMAELMQGAGTVSRLAAPAIGTLGGALIGSMIPGAGTLAGAGVGAGIGAAVGQGLGGAAQYLGDEQMRPYLEQDADRSLRLQRLRELVGRR